MPTTNYPEQPSSMRKIWAWIFLSNRAESSEICLSFTNYLRITKISKIREVVAKKSRRGIYASKKMIPKTSPKTSGKASWTLSKNMKKKLSDSLASTILIVSNSSRWCATRRKPSTLSQIYVGCGQMTNSGVWCGWWVIYFFESMQSSTFSTHESAATAPTLNTATFYGLHCEIHLTSTT